MWKIVVKKLQWIKWKAHLWNSTNDLLRYLVAMHMLFCCWSWSWHSKHVPVNEQAQEVRWNITTNMIVVVRSSTLLCLLFTTSPHNQLFVCLFYNYWQNLDKTTCVRMGRNVLAHTPVSSYRFLYKVAFKYFVLLWKCCIKFILSKFSIKIGSLSDIMTR